MFALRNRETGQLFSCKLVNVYDFEYYGVKTWNDEESARAEFASYLVERGVNEPWVWEVLAFAEDKVRLGNVKLNNNPAKRIYLTDDGRIEARSE